MTSFQSACLNGLVDRIGMALVHFLWQAAAIAVVLAVVLRLLAMLMLAAVLFVNFTWAEAKASADNEPSSAKTATPAAPLTMTAAAFAKLSNPEQRDVLVKAFQQHLEKGKNLFYETEQVYRAFESDNGKPGKPTRKYASYQRYVYRCWQLGDSHKNERFQYDDPKQSDFRYYSADVENARERVGRNTSIDKTGEENQLQGQVVYPYGEESLDEQFPNFPSPDLLMGCSGRQQCFFQYLASKRDEFEIKSPVSGDKVQLIVPWHGDKQVFVLDPEKGFLPIRFEARCDIPGTKGEKPFWFEVKFEVQESRLVDNVWMPVKMRSESPSSQGVLVVHETKVLRIASGSVKPADLCLPFSAGMQVADVIEGVTYTADAQGNATDVKDAPNWKHDPPKGWRKGEIEEASSLASRISAADRKRLVDEREAKSKPIDEGLKILRANPRASQAERIEAALEILRVYPVSEREGDWATAIRELITIGKPALPRLIEELDRTESDKTLRAMGFVLRGIGDPRAVPALIRAIPRLIQPSNSDFGLTIKDDPELLKFMCMHDTDHLKNNKENREVNGLILFTYGRPVREFMPALERFTGQTLGWRQLNFADTKAEGVIQLRRQRTLFLDHARKWADWWSQHWKGIVPEERDAQLQETRRSLDQFAESIARMPQPALPTEIPCGPQVRIDGGASWDKFEPYLSLDTGREPPKPGDLLKNSPKDHPSPELLAWAQREDIDLLRIEIKRPGDSKIYYGYQPVGMKVWKIDNKRLKNLEKELQKSKKLDLPPPWKGPISSLDQQTGDIDEEKPATFLFITRQGTCGTLQIRSAHVHESASYSAVMGSGALEYQYIFEGEPAK